MTGPEVAAAIKVTATIVSIADRRGLFARLKSSFKRKRQVLVLGASGVGKTQFLASLKSVLPDVIDRMDRTEFSVDEVVGLGKAVFLLVDTPGDLGRRFERTSSILRMLAVRPVGVINVVAYGYHENQTGGDTAVQDGVASVGWLEQHQKAEIDALSEWLPMAGDRVEWILTLVNKADLWWNEREDVYRHYNEGEYSKRLEAFAPRHHAVREYSAVQHRFYGSAPVAGDFGQEDRNAIQQRAFSFIIKASDRNQ